jgi:tetratricopeptide (TPR) repeat protein
MSLGLSLIAGVGIKTLPALLRLRLFLFLLIALGATTVTRNADWVSALSLWKDSARKNPFSPRPHNNIGEAYYEKGNLAQATYHFEKSVDNISIFVANQYNIQNRKIFLKNKQAVAGKGNEKILKSPGSIKIKAELVEPHYNLATVYLDQGRLDKAEKEYLKVQALRPGQLSLKIGLSSVYNQKGLYDQALSLLEQAVKENMSSSSLDFALARLNLGELYGKAGRIEDSIFEWKAALKIDPSLYPAHFNLGTAYMMIGKLDPAKNAFKHCLKLNNQHEPALFNLAKVYQMQEKWDESTLQFMVFLRVIGPRPSAYAQIGYNFNKQLDWENAQIFLEKSVLLQPDNVNASIYLAEALSSLGQKEKARKQLQAISNPNPSQSAKISKLMINLTSPKNTNP